MFIRVTRVKFLDSFQAVDMKLALINLKGTVCSNHFGQRIHVAKSQIAHTLTEACVSCEADFGISLQFQKATLIAALQVIWEGQTAYGPAEIQADVMTNEAVAPGQPPRRLGKLWGSTIQIPATPEHYWDRSSFSLKLDGLPGHRISLQTDPILSPTLDIWNTKWFRDLLERTVHQIRDVGRPQTRINSYEVELPPQYMQHIRFSFFSSKVPGTELPTYEVLSSLMITLNNLFKYQGARELKFTLVNDKDGPIAYGHMEFRRPRVNGLGLALINASDTSAAKTSN